ncbi:heavy metal translocating P-type ATPase [Pelagibacterium halotolerans]|uniref:heavy metal translocating P-type ATPase n=1 Tax=Pelagibacterium halotolerans TaxID=531813 RepID=UPI00384B4CE1
MTCCAPSEFADIAQPLPAGPADAEIRSVSRALGDGAMQADISVPGIHCGGCMQKIEDGLSAVPGVIASRVNLSTKRVSLQWQNTDAVRHALETLRTIGYEGHLFAPEDGATDPELRRLVTALAVAAFSAMNIMMLSVGVWSGADAATRDVLHWVSAAIALPALVYSGRVFYLSAWNALRHGQTNMDVPITIGVVLALGLSIYDTATGAAHAYFDAAASLVFFLLAGRTLDHMMRERARTAVKGLAKLAARGAVVVDDTGTREYRPLEDIVPGMRIQLAAGERVPVDAMVDAGASDIDLSLVNGESAPVSITAGARLHAGTLNLTQPITIVAQATAKESFLAEMMRLIEAAEAGRGPHRRIADRVSRFYAPVVHLAAALAFAGWFALSGNLHLSVSVAISVLIITCPCALGLAVPIVHVVAARKLFESGVMLKDGDALERLAEVDTVVFDKTGTLTLGRARLTNRDEIAPDALKIAGAIAAHSRHPFAQAIAHAARDTLALDVEGVTEAPGLGLEATIGGERYRLGRASWAVQSSVAGDATGTVLAREGRQIASFAFEDADRRQAAEAIRALEHNGLATAMLSGDRKEIARDLGNRLGIGECHGDLMPADKTGYIATLSAAGHKVMMVGDGLNDGPALAAAHVSMAPANAADVGRNAAGLVFLRESLMAVPAALGIAKKAARLVRENFALAIAYNVIALPIAVLGHVTPLIAALAMSASSVVVVANALRLMRARLD